MIMEVLKIASNNSDFIFEHGLHAAFSNMVQQFIGAHDSDTNAANDCYWYNFLDAY
jgi:hypothetical protein